MKSWRRRIVNNKPRLAVGQGIRLLCPFGDAPDGRSKRLLPMPQSGRGGRQGPEPLTRCASRSLDGAEKTSFDVDARHLVRQKEPMKDQSPSTQSYAALLKSIKERIQTAQVRAAVAVNQELVLL